MRLADRNLSFPKPVAQNIDDDTPINDPEPDLAVVYHRRQPRPVSFDEGAAEAWQVYLPERLRPCGRRAYCRVDLQLACPTAREADAACVVCERADLPSAVAPPAHRCSKR